MIDTFEEVKEDAASAASGGVPGASAESLNPLYSGASDKLDSSSDEDTSLARFGDDPRSPRVPASHLFKDDDGAFAENRLDPLESQCDSPPPSNTASPSGAQTHNMDGAPDVTNPEEDREPCSPNTPAPALEPKSPIGDDATVVTESAVSSPVIADQADAPLLKAGAGLSPIWVVPVALLVWLYTGTFGVGTFATFAITLLFLVGKAAA